MILKRNIRPNAVLSVTRDVPMLDFLWRWKVSTTSALGARFYPGATLGTAYKRLWRLERAGFIRARCDETASYFVWTLDKKGFAFVRSRLPKLREEGYLSENLKHDLVVTAVHLGDGLLSEMPDIKYATEQELRRYEPEFLPSWVTISSRHRPDGYWRVRKECGHQVIALEVELSPKTDLDYETVGRFYKDHEEIHRVIWVVEKTQFAERILRLAEKYSCGESKHCFVLIKPLLAMGWQATVFHGCETGKSISSILGNSLPTAPHPVGPQLMLNVRKTPHK
jgi:hypothetical protein